MESGQHSGFTRLKEKLLLVGIFLVFTPLIIGTSLFSLYSLTPHNQPPKVLGSTSQTGNLNPDSGVKVFASLPALTPSFSGTLDTSDARKEIIRQYLSSYQSPLTNYYSLLVDISDKYGLDYRLLTAIAQQESNLCKLIPPNSHNCWGWGIHSQGSLGFTSYEEAIETVANGLKEEYVDKGYVTPEEIMSKYTPLSQGSWAFGVNFFMEDMETASVN